MGKEFTEKCAKERAALSQTKCKYGWRLDGTLSKGKRTGSYARPVYVRFVVKN